MRTRIAAAATAALLAGAAAIAQDKAPESLLPPGFNEPVAPAAPAPAPAATAAPSTTGGPAGPLATVPTVSASPSPSPSASPSPIDPATLAQYEMPAFARRSLDRVGTAEGGFAPRAFGTSDGRWLEILMRRTSAPLPSRWLSITLRRALMSSVDTPRGLNGADFAAERAWLLLRMGESVAARSVVQSVDTDRVTPKLRKVWMQAMLANGDPAGACPLVPAALADSPGPDWILTQAMCAALAGPSGTAKPLLAAARRKRIGSGVDFNLAEKVSGAGADSAQAVTIEWDPVVQLTTWRFGLATATGVAVPEPLYATVGPQVTGWRALAPAIPLGDRAPAAERAAAMGVLSTAALVDLYSAADEMDDTPSPVAAVSSDLRAAYVGATLGARRSALRQLWDGGKDAPYARLVLTARAAARIPVAADYDDPDRLVASMLSAGLDRTAARWRSVIREGTDAWAMLALADPDSGRRYTYNQISSYAGNGDAARKRQLLFAGLAGLGRLSSGQIEQAAQALDVKIGAGNSWTRALDRAAGQGEAGTVILLAAIGMQTADWRGVPAESLYRIVGALRAVGLEGEARMIAAEAIARS